MTDTEFNQYKLSVLSKTSGMNIHKVNNMLGAMEMSMNEYNHTKNYKLLRVASKAKKEINRIVFC